MQLIPTYREQASRRTAVQVYTTSFCVFLTRHPTRQNHANRPTSIGKLTVDRRRRQTTPLLCNGENRSARRPVINRPASQDRKICGASQPSTRPQRRSIHLSIYSSIGPANHINWIQHQAFKHTHTPTNGCIYHMHQQQHGGGIHNSKIVRPLPSFHPRPRRRRA